VEPVLIGAIGPSAVGVIGIVATYWTGRKVLFVQTRNIELQIRVESERARVAEKRQIYATFVAMTSKYVAVVHSLAVERTRNGSEIQLASIRAELDQAMQSMLTSLGEIRLIAPEGLAIMSVKVVQKLTTTEDLASIFPEMREKLYVAMRADLGEPPHHPISVSELVSQALKR